MSAKNEFQEICNALDSEGKFVKTISKGSAFALVASTRGHMKKELGEEIDYSYDNDSKELTIVFRE